MLLLRIKGKIKKISFLSHGHWIGLTKNNNYIHFKSTKHKDILAPFWFEGKLELIRPHTIYKSKILGNC